MTLLAFSPRDGSILSQDSRNPIQIDSSKIAKAQQKWMQCINSDIEALGESYIENAVKINGAGEVLEGPLAIVENYRSQELQIDSVNTLKKIVAVLDSTIIYEIGHFWSTDQPFAHLVLWRNTNGTLLRELEFVTPIGANEANKDEISSSREQWMSLCNANNVKELVTEMYTENARYYNHKPMVMGREAITDEYEYMNNPAYQLKLNPLIVEMVNKTLAFEIGQCSGSYPGNYVLVWQKGEDDTWRILLDSNI